MQGFGKGPHKPMVAALLLSIIRISPSIEEEELNVAQTAYLVTL